MSIKKENLKPIIKYLKPYKKAIYITSVFVILENIIQLILPIFFGKIVDNVIKFKTFNNYIIILLSIWIIILFLDNWLLRIKTRRSNALSNYVSSDLLVSSIKHLAKLPMGFHKSKKIGEIIQRFSRAEEYIYRILNEGIFMIVPNLLVSFFAFVIILWINWILAVIYILFIIIYIFATVKKTKPLIKHQKKINKSWEKVYGDIFDRTPNIVTIKSNSSEDTENERNKRNTAESIELNIKQLKMWTDMMRWQNSIFNISFLLLFCFAIFFVSRDMITIGQFVMLISYINIASSAIDRLGGYYKQFQEGLVTINRADKIFNEETENYDDPKAITLKDCQGNVEFRDINFSYDSENVLENINFKAEAGSMVAIVGKSGEGKSTLVDLVSRYIIPTSGNIFLDSINIQKIKLKNLRQQIAIVPQEINLFNDSILNNIAYSNPDASFSEIENAARMAHCHEFIEKFPEKYKQIVGEKGVKLSTGQKQRVAIARAILRDPKILILDEATSALDSESEKYVQEALETVMKGRTTFVIAHRLSTIRKADLILVLQDGKIIESGDHKELINKGGVYQKLSELQQISV